MNKKDNIEDLLLAFRPVGVGQAAQMALLYRQQLAEASGQPIPATNDEDLTGWRGRLSNKLTWSVGAYEAGELVGYAISFPGPGLDGNTPQPKTRIRILTAMKKYREVGLLDSLLDRAIEIASQEGVSVLEICLLESERAMIELVKSKKFYPNGIEREQGGQAKIHYELKLLNNGKTSRTFNVAELETQTDDLASELKIDPSEWAEFRGYLGRLKKHNELMYLHSLRVGIYAAGMADNENWSDLKLAFLGGCGHDYGKCLVPNSVLNAKHYDDETYEKVKEHSFKGYEALKDKFLFTAFIAGLHHKYQLGGKSNYGIDLEQVSPVKLSPDETETIERTAELVALADFFDAIVTRRNDRGLVKKFGDMGEAKGVMLKYFEPWAGRVEWLFDHHID